MTISRRGFAAFAVGGAAISVQPRAAEAADIEALAIMCIDYRLVDDGVLFLTRSAT
jgi:hypothetical protein